jgi:hypothetical protein
MHTAATLPLVSYLLTTSLAGAFGKQVSLCQMGKLLA